MKRCTAQWLKGLVGCLLFSMTVFSMANDVQAQDKAAGSPASARVWLTPGASEALDRAEIRARCVAGQTAEAPVTFTCTVTSQYAVDDPLLKCQIRDSAGQIVNDQSLIMFIDKSERIANFSWDMKAVPDGLYTARFSLERRPKFLMVWHEYVIHKTTAESVRKAHDEAKLALEALQDKTQGVPSFGLRWNLAQDALNRSRVLLDCGDTPQADSFVRYTADVAAKLQAETDPKNIPVEMGVGDPNDGIPPELHEAVPSITLPITVHDGGFYSGSRPVFLMGFNYGVAPTATELDRLKTLGFNLAAFAITPKDTLASDQELKKFEGAFNGVFEKASTNGLSLMVSLDPLSLPRWLIEKNPALQDNGLGESDILQPESREQTKRHFQAVARYVADKPSLLALSLMDNVRFKFTGEETRAAFQTWALAQYPNLQTLARGWRANFDSIQEANIGWADTDARYQRSSAYRYDWQIFQQLQGVSYIKALSGLIKESAPHVAQMAAPSSTAFDQGESAFGVDREEIARTLDLNGCCVPNSILDEYYALRYPDQAVTYALLRSFAPAKPLVNLQDTVSTEALTALPSLYGPMHASLWDAAMEGLNASTLSGSVGGLSPEALEGYAMACLEINRLAPLVAAFQQAPAEIGILWSMPSKIINDGLVNLTSARSAYEGSSFLGYKTRFISERQVQAGELVSLSVLVIPETPALADVTFPVLRDYVQSGANVVTTPTQIAYDERGQSRRDMINSARRTFLVRGQNLPTEYLHALDAVASEGGLPDIPRIVNDSGYPIEGVKSRCVTVDGVRYLYVINLRKKPINGVLHGPVQQGRDLIRGRNITFPTSLEPLDPMLIRLDKVQ